MKNLPTTDFRSHRYVLEPDDFALGSSDPDPPASDLIEEATWKSIVSLPDDVGVRTSDHYGTALVAVWSYFDEWNCLVGALQSDTPNPSESPLEDAALEISDDLQASVYNALVGFYRVAFSCLRNAVELMTVGLQLERQSDPRIYTDYLNGDREIKLGTAADRLGSDAKIKALENQLLAKAGDNLFRQRSASDSGGLVRRLFTELSKFTHSAPGYTDAAMRQSNGPIFVAESFERWEMLFRKCVAVAVLEAKLGRHSLDTLGYGSSLTAKQFFESLVEGVDNLEDGSLLLHTIPPETW